MFPRCLYDGTERTPFHEFQYPADYSKTNIWVMNWRWAHLSVFFSKCPPGGVCVFEDDQKEEGELLSINGKNKQHSRKIIKLGKRDDQKTEGRPTTEMLTDEIYFSISIYHESRYISGNGNVSSKDKKKGVPTIICMIRCGRLFECCVYAWNCLLLDAFY